jgi:hypothetical protein
MVGDQGRGFGFGFLLFLVRAFHGLSPFQGFFVSR